MNIRLLPILLFFIFYTNSFAQVKERKFSSPLNFRIFGSKEGFYSDRVKVILQDDFGFLWIGTKEGLLKFDGHEFINFNNENPVNRKLLTSDIENIIQDKKGSLWVCTAKGVITYNQSEGIFHPIEFPKKEDYYVVSLSEAENGDIWVGTNLGIYSIDSHYKSKPFFDNKKLIKTIPRVTAQKNNRLLAVSHNFIYHYNLKTSELEFAFKYAQDINLNDNVHTHTNLDKQGYLWIAKHNGDLFQYNPKSHHLKKYDLKIICQNASAIPDCIFSKEKEKTWFAINESGIWYYDYSNEKFTEYITPDKTGQNIPSYKTSPVYIDKDNNLWFGIANNGLAMTNDHLNIFHNLFLKPAFKSAIVSAIYKDKDQRIWVGTDGGGIHLYDLNSKYIKSFVHDDRNPSSISNDAVMSIFEDSKKRLWVGTFRGGLNQYHPENNTFTHIMSDPSKKDGLLRNDIRKIAEDKEGNLWLVVHGSGISCFNPQKKSFENYDNVISIWTNDVLVDHQGTVWAATNNGVIKKKSGIKIFEDRHSNSLLNKITDLEINCLMEDKQHNIWIGTSHGLYKYYKEKAIIEVKSLPQFQGVNVKSIQQNAQGFLFISSTEGIFQLSPDNTQILQFNEGDGLLENGFIINSSFIDNKTLFFGTGKGLCWFEPKALSRIENHRKPLITNIKVFNKSILPAATTAKLSQSILSTKAINLEYNENHLIFEFAQPSYLRSEKAGFEYKMDGVDKEWQNSGSDREAVYHGLQPGKYTLTIRTKNNLSIQNNNPVTVLSVVINPPIWETWWFRTLLFLSIIGLIYWYTINKTQAVKIKNKELEDKVNTRTSELLEKTELLKNQHAQLEVANASKNKLFSIIAHDLRSPFSAVIQWSELLNKNNEPFEKQKEILSHIKNASKNAYQVLENLLQWARTQTNRIVYNPQWIDLNRFTITMVETYSYKAKEKNISLEFVQKKPFKAMADKNMLETIVRNLLDNAIKFTSSNGSVSIDITNSTNGFILLIKDTGIGMTQLQMDKLCNINTSVVEANQESSLKGEGLGLYLCKEFMAYHNASWEISSDISSGTQFKIYFPVDCIDLEETAPVEIEFSSKVDVTPNIEMLIDLKDRSLLQQKTILVVEDQIEIRKLIVHYLEKYFIIQEAENGAIAQQIVKEVMPDLIISDVVMPEINGIDFVTLLKKDIITCHIPIILLTSQKEESDIINGLQTGADDYLLKPFNSEILVLKSAQLLLNRERLKKKFRLDDTPSLDAISENSFDKQLLKKVYKIIDENITVENFGVEILSSMIGMHRSTFSKKITAITGYPPQDLIKSHRLKVAAQLILASGKNISEIAYEVGFSDPKYFSRSFKTYFGISPSEYSEHHKNE